MKQVATTWTGTNEAKHLCPSCPEAQKHVHQRAEAEAELEKESEGNRGRGGRRQLETLRSSALSKGLSPLWHTFSKGFRVLSHPGAVSNGASQVILKPFGSRSQCRGAHGLSRPLVKIPIVSQSSFLLFIPSLSSQTKKLMSCFKYIYICIHVHFHSGQQMTSTAKPCIFRCTCPWESSIPMWVKRSQLSTVLCHNKIYTYLGHKL